MRGQNPQVSLRPRCLPPRKEEQTRPESTQALAEDAKIVEKVTAKHMETGEGKTDPAQEVGA